ncbi:hypothetical protein [Jannaschia seohaensis]|uniref:Uncharacterized protein n=1 Tax=Jannaschia seohaensis TaxID=475081 RepID=A0A2Y9AES2_9RHOB|nr:hypothetical protein [Jannaschia seohaensis]PWJ21328.1 hypothetical protein BCF38_102579 [Jannaschia seohaensis]SSA41778.1 hypothetical protein SAMN05421539_102579 [Jannaschia seohaensis]
MQHFDINVGDYFTGEFDSIVFIADDDADGVSEATFSNINLFDEGLEAPMAAPVMDNFLFA